MHLLGNSQSGPAAVAPAVPPAARASHAPPSAATWATHEPIAVAVSPTHASSTAHGSDAFAHAPPTPTGIWHAIAPVHSIVGPQPLFAHDCPTAGGSWHVPHSDVFAIAQNADLHCALKLHGLPSELAPAGDRHCCGGITPDRNAPHVSIASAVAQVAVWLGVFAVPFAASASVHASFSRVSQ